VANKVIIIGAGISGLASAIRLANRNFNVTIIESSDKPGGKIKSFSLNGFRFDTGPSLFTEPHLITELIEESGELPEECFPFVQLKKVCHYFYPNGKKILVNKDNLEHDFYKAFGEPVENTLRFLKHAEKIFRITEPVFLKKSLHKPSTYLNFNTLNSFLQLKSIDSFRTMNKANESFFEKPESIQFFNRFATYNGSDPYRAPATLNLIPTLELLRGAYFPKNGMIQISKTLTDLCLKKGVVFRFNEKVQKINTDKGKATGVTTNMGYYDADIIVSNSDAYYTYQYLLENKVKAEKIKKLERSGSALIFYWGIADSFPELGLHNIFFADDYKKEFTAIFKGELSDDLTVYINITSKLNPVDAPSGMENWFVMINAPSNPEYFTVSIIEKVKNLIIQKLEKMLKKNIRNKIIAEEILTPALIESKMGSYKGALYGTSSNNKFSAFFRPANYTSSVKGLYLCGGSVHPGGGIPLCLLSAKIVDSLII
jgi:phytoene desaturase